MRYEIVAHTFQEETELGTAYKYGHAVMDTKYKTMMAWFGHIKRAISYQAFLEQKNSG